MLIIFLLLRKIRNSPYYNLSHRQTFPSQANNKTCPSTHQGATSLPDLNFLFKYHVISPYLANVQENHAFFLPIKAWWERKQNHPTQTTLKSLQAAVKSIQEIKFGQHPSFNVILSQWEMDCNYPLM